MKKVLFILIIFFIGAQTYAQESGIEFFDGKWKKLLKEGKKKDKLIFIDAYASWCGPCKKMAKEIFVLDDVGQIYNEHFVNYQMDMEKGEGIEIAKEYNVKAFPTYLFLNSNGELVHRAIGFMQAEKFIKLAETAMDSKSNLKYFMDEYQKGKNEPEFLLDYAIMLNNAYMDHKKISSAYFSTVPENALFEENNWRAIKELIDNPESEQFMFLLQHADQFKERFGNQEVEQKISFVLYRTLFLNFRKDENMSIEKFLETYLYSAGSAGLMAVETNLKLYFYLSLVKDYNLYAITALAFLESNIDKLESSQKINEIGWTFYEQIDNEAQLSKVLEFVEMGIGIEDGYHIHDTYAALLFKTDRFVEARESAEQAISLAEEENIDYSSTTKLLEKIKEATGETE